MAEKKTDTPVPTQAPLQEGVDFYMENGLFVLTEHFLRKRGYCCRNGCRHCPYGFREEGGKERTV
jgi:hypothetical protein